jgi:uncharacterized protein (DUF4415 family)
VTQKSENIVRYTAEELRERRKLYGTLTDWARVDALTEEELEASIDYEEEGYPDWSMLQKGIPGPKKQLTVRYDADIVDWFKAQGDGYQTKMNAVLRSYVDAHKNQK